MMEIQCVADRAEDVDASVHAFCLRIIILVAPKDFNVLIVLIKAHVLCPLITSIIICTHDGICDAPAQPRAGCACSQGCHLLQTAKPAIVSCKWSGAS